MAYETKPNTGALFANRERKSDKHPQASGTALIDGVEYFIDAWTNMDRNDNKYQSLKFKRKDKQASAAPARQQSYAEASGASAGEIADDDLPF